MGAWCYFWRWPGEDFWNRRSFAFFDQGEDRENARAKAAISLRISRKQGMEIRSIWKKYEEGLSSRYLCVINAVVQEPLPAADVVGVVDA